MGVKGHFMVRFNYGNVLQLVDQGTPESDHVIVEALREVSSQLPYMETRIHYQSWEIPKLSDPTTKI